MPTSHTINPQDVLQPERSVREVQLGVGQLVITRGTDTEVLEAPASYEADGAANLLLYSPDGARINLVFADEPVTATHQPRPARAGTATNAPRTTGAPKKTAKKKK